MPKKREWKRECKELRKTQVDLNEQLACMHGDLKRGSFVVRDGSMLDLSQSVGFIFCETGGTVTLKDATVGHLHVADGATVHDYVTEATPLVDNGTVDLSKDEIIKRLTELCEERGKKIEWHEELRNHAVNTAHENIRIIAEKNETIERLTKKIEVLESDPG